MPLFIWIITACWLVYYIGVLIYAYFKIPERFGVTFPCIAITVILIAASITAYESLGYRLF